MIVVTFDPLEECVCLRGIRPLPLFSLFVQFGTFLRFNLLKNKNKTNL